jgi:hypothetical protein
MGNFLLSVASPDTLSWIGFVVLGLALVGEVGVNVIPSKFPAAHSAAAFGFAVLAAGGYAVERLGDDALIKGLETRATLAELEVEKMKHPRTVKNAAQAADKLREFKNIKFWIVTETPDKDSGSEQMVLSEQMRHVFQVANWQQDDHLNRYSKEPFPWFGPCCDRGCLLSTADDKKSLAMLKAALEAFKAEGVECTEYVDPNIISDSMLVNVGLR